MPGISGRLGRKGFIWLLIAAFGSSAAAAAAPANVEIVQSRGVDQRVDYSALAKFGPWDDRNYELTAQDLKVLAPNEQELHPQIPAFFRVELRKEWPTLRRSGAAQYPRAARQLFEIRYGGLMQNGKIAHDRRELAKVPVPVNSEIQLNQVLGANEVTVEINPSNPLQVIAGSNNAGGQEMYYSTDGGVTWTIQGVLPNTCCDPTIDWSSDGTVAYAAALSGGAIGVSAWRSFDGGQTWVDRRDITSGGSDKEFIHVDKSLASPYTDNVYVTYHNSNTMQFARSTDMGNTYTIQSFPGAPSGIGSDITTDSDGNIYYAYGAFGTRTIELLKSTDGGDTFAASQTVYSTNGSFDWPIPSMETRRAWIYVAADADRSAGTFDGSVYLSWTDTVDLENDGSATANHTRVWVAYSRDGGATWNRSTPHPTNDMDTVDRWNQWMTVDENGGVHVVYYDTRHSANRTGVDLYYTFSTDGGVTWNDPARISSATSANLTDLQEFGDYNGISVVGEKIIQTWTDNRDGPSDKKDVYAADVPNVTPPGFTLSTNQTSQDVCAPGNLDDITILVGSFLEYADPVTLNYSGLPAGFSGGFSVNPVTPGNTTLAQISVGSVAAGTYDFSIGGTGAGADGKALALSVNASSAVPAVTSLLSPANGATDQSTSPDLSWSPVANAVSYTVELDDDPGFGSPEFAATVAGTSVPVDTGLAVETIYYWRVRANNACGSSADSATFSFTTGIELCRSDVVSIPDNGSTSDLFAVAASGEITDINVSVKATHTWVGDLRFILTHQDTGTSVVFIDRPGVPALSSVGCSGANIDATLDDEATDPVEDECSSNPAIGGTFTPNNPLSAFDGEDLSGTWRLDVSDNAGLDTGTLDEWCLLPTTASTAADTDGDGVTDDSDNCVLVPNPTQLDTNGDDIGNHCDADINGDCLVNFGDLALLKAGWFPVNDPDADFTGEGNVNFGDLAFMKSTFFNGANPGPGPGAPGNACE